MRILIDECLDWRLARGLPGHEVTSVPRMGWAGIKNGRLMALAEKEFDVFLTGDRNLSFHQNTTKLGLAVIVLAAASTQLKDTLPLMPVVLAHLPLCRPGMVTVISVPAG
jgi:predicted nuclease of predicted toxin-antitoxin system